MRPRVPWPFVPFYPPNYAARGWVTVHEAQVLTYLKLTGLDVGLLVNFNTPVLRAGIRRLVRRGADGVRLAQFRTKDDHPRADRPASTRPEAARLGTAGAKR
jgi:PD-(D/E)XK nuclease superfamily